MKDKQLLRVSRMVKYFTYHVEVGDVIAFDLETGQTVEAMAVKEEEDGMIFITVDCLRDKYPMNKTSSNRGGYDKSNLRKTLNNSILKTFPAEIREKMIPFPNGDLLRLPTEKEIFGCNNYGADEGDGVVQFEPMKLRRNRIAFQGMNGSYEWYWLSNKIERSAAHFAFVHSNGGASFVDASYAYGVRPVFKLKNG